mgnify:CR=1 FL=1
MPVVKKKILRSKKIRKRLGKMSTTTFWRLRKQTDFPEAVKIQGTSIKGWYESEVDQWIAANLQEVE